MASDEEIRAQLQKAREYVQHSRVGWVSEPARIVALQHTLDRLIAICESQQEQINELENASR